ncbi:unnamed protein product [Ectocarpus sp. 12 AP-2014]
MLLFVRQTKVLFGFCPALSAAFVTEVEGPRRILGLKAWGEVRGRKRLFQSRCFSTSCCNGALCLLSSLGWVRAGTLSQFGGGMGSCSVGSCDKRAVGSPQTFLSLIYRCSAWSVVGGVQAV